MSEYFVVLRTKEKPKLFQPVLTWFCFFESKDDFYVWYTEEVRLRQEIIKEGISTEKEAREICGLAKLNLYKKGS